ncbi:MAG: hypothetical protein QXQ46_04435 [Thermoplasmatales archaeon]
MGIERFKGYTNLLRKFSVKYVPFGNSIKDRIFYRSIFSFINTMAIGVYSGRSVNELASRDRYLYDETLINCCEEGDMAIRSQLNGCKIEYVDYKILPMIGHHLAQVEVDLLGTKSVLFTCQANWKMNTT